MHHLLSRPVLDLGDVPLLYQQLFSKGERAKDDRVWLLSLLRDGLCSQQVRHAGPRLEDSGAQ
jgi:nucleolar pre-ribosomal-associated protein 1